MDKYSFIRVDNCFYSVPDYLVGQVLTVKAYPEEVIVFSGFSEVCRHQRLVGHGLYSVDIFHYLDTLARKPGAVKNSVALRSKARLKDVFDKRYSDRPKEFIALLEGLRGRPIDEVADTLEGCPGLYRLTAGAPPGRIAENVYRNTKEQLAATSAAFLKAGGQVAC